MEKQKSVLIVGFDPKFLDFSSPELAPMQLTAEKILTGLKADCERLTALGYEPDQCLIDTGQTAVKAVAERLSTKKYGCVVIGAGVRTNSKFLILFEKLVNVVHELAPNAKICFNTKPTDTAEAVQRWLN